MKLYRACAYVIVDEDKLLAAERGFGPSEPIAEGKPWVAVKSWLQKAKSAGERVPFIVWDAKNLNRWLGWGFLINLQIRDIDDDHRQTPPHSAEKSSLPQGSRDCNGDGRFLPVGAARMC